ncbi:hypothetical protein BCR44DRAFT_1202798 [Catenaria anguillulae PL171]|uniref:Ankyrin repeat-containing domain protein n=1 Tax=Catenaria anguillulae PL171 TaxID=765915 RepID=A0A1Y2HFQ5_9FUNG|nr:hypothetical protein BCR44DRAFT_1202798 [Catenaria anguillulae PL171]
MLTEDLVLAILTTALRLRFPFVHSRSFGCRMRVADATAALVPVLNVVPRSICPELTHLTLMLMPWIDSDVAARLGDIWLLDTLHTKLTCPPWNRPVQYTLPKALSERALMGMVMFWIGGDVCWVTVRDDLEGVVDGACANGHVIVVEWWARRGKALDDLCEGSAADLLNVAAVAGHLDVVAALWHLASEQGCLRLLDGHATLARVILADRIHVLEWVLDQVEGSGIGISESEVTGAFMAAAAVGHQQALQVLLDRFGAALFTPAVAAFACAGGSVTFVEWCASKVEANATVAIFIPLQLLHCVGMWPCAHS